MTYLVTGGRGFIGSYVVRDLARQGKQVIAMDTLTDPLADSLLTAAERSQVEFVLGDPADFGQLARLVVQRRVTKLLHLTSILNPLGDENPLLAERVNNLGFANALEAARLWNLRLVWASSVVVFGPAARHETIPVPNDGPHHPTTVYAACKSYNEFLARHYENSWGVDHIGLRLTLVYGPGRTRGASAFVNRVVEEAALERHVRVPFGDDEIDWQYVEDVSRLCVLCASIPAPRTRILNTCADVRPLRDGCEHVRRLVPEASFTYEPGRFGVPWRLDDSEFRRDITFDWQWPMEAGVERVINFARHRAGLRLITAVLPNTVT